MNPTFLKLTNVGRFANVEINLPEGLVAIQGPNGAGKSMLANSIELALFADGSRDLAGCLSPWADRLEIELVFSHAGERYRVRRGYGKGRSTLDFDRWGDDDSEAYQDHIWRPLTRENTSATQALINATLGLSRRTFGASAFLAQGSAGAFPEATAADRKAMLGEILDPHGFWPKVALQATAERREAEASILVNQGRIADGLAQAQGIEPLRIQWDEAVHLSAETSSTVEFREAEVATAQTALAEVQAAAERVRTLTAERDMAKQAVDRAAGDLLAAWKADEALILARNEQNALSPGAVSVEHLEAKVEEQRRLTEARQEALRREDNLRRERKELLAQIETVAHQGVIDKTKHSDLTLQADELEQHPHEQHHCETCGQSLPDEARAKVIDGLRERALSCLISAQSTLELVDALERQVRDLQLAAEAIQIPEVPTDDYAGQLAQVRKTEARRIELGVLIQGYEEKAARLGELREAHELMELALRAREAALSAAGSHITIGDPADDLALADVNLRDARSSLADIQQRQARLEQQIETLTELATKVVAMQAEVADAQKQIDLLKLAERAFGRDGIPSLIVESVIGVIEAETNRLLEKMPTSDGETFRVELRTQRTLKTADHLKETLDIVVYDRDGERSYETYSGGEQARLNICLRIALALLLADRRGAESRLLVVDELEYLDSLGQEQLIDVIQSVSHRFDRTIVVSHHPGIRDAFDNTLRIVKDNGVSRVLPSDGDSVVAAMNTPAVSPEQQEGQ